MKATLHIDKEFTVGEVSDKLFGSFLEHLGRAVYGGIFEPGHPEADARGFRKDSLAMIRELNVPLVRYPGGNFVSGFRWEDSVGPAASRPRRLDLAWKSVETNRFGLDEFMDWCALAGTEPMMAVNLGTRGVDAALSLLEYCNHPGGTALSDMRRANGHAAPHGIKLWCLGNEMDGPWQLGQKTPEEYGRVAYEAAKAMKILDPGIELCACGSSSGEMPTFPRWEETVLEHCYDKVDYLSLHQYQIKTAVGEEAFRGAALSMDRFIERAAATCDHVRSKLRAKKPMMLSFDEWNVWYRTLNVDGGEPWREAPPLLEEVYDLEDAVVFGTLVNSLLRHADRVKVACLAQLVNVIAPIMTRTGGPAWKQTIFWPFALASAKGRGTSLDLRASSPSYECESLGEVPYLDAAAVLSRDGAELSLFLANRHLGEPMELALSFPGFERFSPVERVGIHGKDPAAANTEARPDAVAPVREDLRSRASSDEAKEGRATIRLPPLSWNLVTLRRD